MASGRHVSESNGFFLFGIIAAALAAVLALAYLVSSFFFIFVGGSFISRSETKLDLSGEGIRSINALLRLKDPEEIDLRGNRIDAGEYKALAGAFPYCEILWDVPLDNSTIGYDCLSESLTVSSFSPDKAELYALFPNLKEVDLRGAWLSEEDFMLLKSVIPDCHIIWTITIGDERVDSTTKKLSLGDIAEEDVKLFSYFEDLRSLELTGKTHGAYMELERILPNCEIKRSVAIGEELVDSKADTLNLEGSSFKAEELRENLRYLPNVKTVRLDGRNVDRVELAELRATYPRVSFGYDVSIGGKIFSCDETVVAPGKINDVEALIEALPGFTELTELDLRESGLDTQQLIAVADAYPELFIRADVELYGLSCPTDSTELDFSGIKIEETKSIEDALILFPKLEKVIMSNCGISDEDMDALNRRHKDVLFVWTIHFSIYNVRTDATAFCASNVPGYVAPKLGDYDLAPIKYLTELEALDLGHMYYTDLSFLENMPKLRYLILVEASYRDISAIASLSELYYLELFNNTINDLSPLLECKNLRHLNIGFTRGYDEQVLKEMTWLERFWFPGLLLEEEELEDIAEALPDTECYYPRWDTDGSTGGGWREHDSYYTMRDLFSMHYMPGGTGMGQN